MCHYNSWNSVMPLNFVTSLLLRHWTHLTLFSVWSGKTYMFAPNYLSSDNNIAFRDDRWSALKLDKNFYKSLQN